MPIPFFDANAQRALAKHILRELERVRTLEATQGRARAYECLGNDYRELHMYGRSIEMYRQSLAASPSQDVQIRLAELLINLLGEAGFDEARRLVNGHPPLTRRRPVVLTNEAQIATSSAPSAQEMDQLIERKRGAIRRQEQRATLNRKHPPLKALVGESQHILDVCQQIIHYAPTTLPVLITGDTGSGKEVAARAFHASSPRSKRAFIPINCAAVPKDLFESEMFGHVKGAFTGAIDEKKGLMEEADGGTLFLDEVGDLSLIAQPKILRAIQEGEIWRLGGTTPIKVNVRVIAATNKILAEAIHHETFREDLYSRLKGVEITLPPLEERLEDLLPLVKHFVQNHQLGQFSDYDLFCWIQFHFLPAYPATIPYQDSIATALEAAGLNYQHKAPVHGPPQSKLDIRQLENAVQRAVADKTLAPQGDYAFEDVWTHGGKTFPGPTKYTLKQLKDYDLAIARELLSTQEFKRKDVAKLLGKSESWTSRHLQPPR